MTKTNIMMELQLCVAISTCQAWGACPVIGATGVHAQRRANICNSSNSKGA